MFADVALTTVFRTVLTLIGMFGSSESRYISPTLSLKPTSDSPQFHQERPSNQSLTPHESNYPPTGQAPHQVSKRFLHPLDLNSKQVNYKIRVPEATTLAPLQLGQKYITDLTKIDSITPNDLYLGELNPQESALDNYHCDFTEGLGDFARFEQTFSLNLPDKFFAEYNGAKTTFKMGMFASIDRVWLAVDNRLLLWNYHCPPSSFNHGSQFTTIDQVKHTILSVAMVPPKKGVFKPEITEVLVVATTNDIHLFLVTNKGSVELYDPQLSVSVQGLAVNQIAVHPKTNDIYFCCEGDGCNVWRLDYSNRSSFIKNKCDKVCMTKSALGAVLPHSIWGGAASEIPTHGAHETVVRLAIDGDRNMVYTLSNKSTLRAYKLSDKHDSLHETQKLTSAQLLKMVGSIYGPTTSIETFKEFGIINIEVVSQHESAVVHLVAVTTSGCRILLKLAPQGYFSSTVGNKLAVVSVKFPPSKDVPQINAELDSFARSKQYLSQMISNQQRSRLLVNTKLAKVISPGIFIAVKRTKRSDKVFIATPNYGYLKKNNKLVEDAEFYSIGDGETPTYVQDIVQLTAPMNGTNTPQGYANVMATQYTKQPLRFAVLTNKGVKILEYRHSDKVLSPLKEETVEYFIEENGYEETCNTLLYLACSLNNDISKRKASLLFSSCGEPARLQESTVPLTGAQLSQLAALSGQAPAPVHGGASSSSQHPTVDQVVLSDRFYGTCLLISRVFRDIWFLPVFVALPYIKTTSGGAVEKSSIKSDNLVIGSLSISKSRIEFFIGTMVVLLEFFHSSGIASLVGQSTTGSDPSQFDSEISLRAEHIAFSSILKSLESIKEGLTFLLMLLEQQNGTESSLDDILKGMSVSSQVNLLSLSYKDLLLPNREVKLLVKDLLSNIINQKIVKGNGSIDIITKSLKGKCESFCSTDDVLIFKAIENLTKAKNIGPRDSDLRDKCLRNAMYLFEQAFASVTYENIEMTVEIMVDLEFYQGAVELILSLLNKIGRSPNSNKNDDNKLRQKLYQLVFSVLTKVDLKALKLSDSDKAVSQFITQVRDPTYELCFNSKDKDFDFALYQWFVDQGVPERLLQITAGPVLEFLNERAPKSLEMSNLLWSYYAKREDYFDAASVLYGLAISGFQLELSQRIEYLARANGFCNCTCPPNLRQKMIELSSVVTELFDIATIQMDLVRFVKKDTRIGGEVKKSTVSTLLNSKIMSISELFNQFSDPLGYFELDLLIFYVSDYKNTDDILKRWELLMEKVYYNFSQRPEKMPLYLCFEELFSDIGPKISDNDLVFPLDDLIKQVAKYINEAINEFGTTQKPPVGFLTNLFLNSGVSYDKIYHVIRSVITFDNHFEIYPGFTKELETQEMGYLITQWYTHDKKLRDRVGPEGLEKLNSGYTTANDPIDKLLIAP